MTWMKSRRDTIQDRSSTGSSKELSDTTNDHRRPWSGYLWFLWTQPMSTAKTAFWACIRFSAWSNTTEWGPSITSSVISWPRCAGRQCITRTSGPAALTRAALT